MDERIGKSTEPELTPDIKNRASLKKVTTEKVDFLVLELLYALSHRKISMDSLLAYVIIQG